MQSSISWPITPHNQSLERTGKRSSVFAKCIGPPLSSNVMRMAILRTLQSVKGGRMNRTITYVFLPCLLVTLICGSAISADVELIQGHYCYTYGDNESLVEARKVVRNLAVRNAIESYNIFVQSTSSVDKSILTEDLITTISGGYLTQVETVEHIEKGRTICDTIIANVSPKEIREVIRTELEKRKSYSKRKKAATKREIQEKIVYFRPEQPTNTDLVLQLGDTVHYINPTVPFKVPGRNQFHIISKTTEHESTGYGSLVIYGHKQKGFVHVRIVPGNK